jgi:hypothetical protein
LHKKGDDEKQDDNNPQFHEKLRRALEGQAKVNPFVETENSLF